MIVDAKEEIKIPACVAGLICQFAGEFKINEDAKKDKKKEAAEEGANVPKREWIIS